MTARLPRSLALRCLVAAAACTASGMAKRNIKILFVGNSLTYVNDLPGKIAQIANSPGSVISVTTASSVEGGTAWKEVLRWPRLGHRRAHPIHPMQPKWGPPVAACACALGPAPAGTLTRASSGRGYAHTRPKGRALN